MSFHSILRLASLATLFLALLGCGTEGSSGGRGTIKVGITDAPIDNAENVFIHFTAAVLHGDHGDTRVDIIDPVDNSKGRSINLLALQGGQWTGLFEETVGSGLYSSIRLEMDITKSYIQIRGEKHNLLCTSCEQSSYKLSHNFRVEPDQVLTLMLDFDLHKSITEPVSGSPDYILRPSLRAVEIEGSGSISGKVDAELLRKLGGSEGCAVYVFKNFQAQLDDIYIRRTGEVATTAQNNPVSIAMIRSSGNFAYNVPFLPAGQYTVAVTCEADMDLANSDDTLVFSKSENVIISAGESVNLDFVISEKTP